jgi:hypothetical protein
MKKILAAKLVQRMLVLSFLCVAFVFVMSSSQPTQASNVLQCCYSCEAAEAMCDEPNHGGYPSYAACMNGYMVWFCYSHCTYDSYACS